MHCYQMQPRYISNPSHFTDKTINTMISNKVNDSELLKNRLELLINLENKMW